MDMLFQRALAPEGSGVLVPALNVCIALLEPKRTNMEGGYGMGSPESGANNTGNAVDTAQKDALKNAAIKVMPLSLRRSLADSILAFGLADCIHGMAEPRRVVENNVRRAKAPTWIETLEGGGAAGRSRLGRGRGGRGGAAGA
eukprot:scaffold32998_cov49-Prasinocladus_malaysianus.AAC.1